MSLFRPRYCRFCANHNIQSLINGHRGQCNFDNCICERCFQVRERNRRERERRLDQAAVRATFAVQLANSSSTGGQNAGQQSAVSKRADDTRKRRADERNVALNEHLNNFFAGLSRDDKDLPFMTNTGRAFRSFVPFETYRSGKSSTSSRNTSTTTMASTTTVGSTTTLTSITNIAGTSNTNTTTTHTQESLLQKLCFLEEMFSNIPSSTLHTALISSNGSLQDVISFLVDEPKKDEYCTPTSVADCRFPCLETGNKQSGTEEVVGSIFSSLGTATPAPPAPTPASTPASAPTLISFSGPSVPQLPSLPSHPLSTLLSSTESGPLSSCSNDNPGRRPHRCHYCGFEWPAFTDNNYCPQCYMPYNKRDRY